ncbi:MAG: hypothetical protein HLUCCO16_01575 [Phormidium sp. OSCR]|nr:MAG: hypothetical protein HLUCCO16_01575 [Phormidium sp. OSCR]
MLGSPRRLSLSFPRKGTETYPFPERRSPREPPAEVFPYLFPARGRKHREREPPRLGYPRCLSLSFPRKGTETIRSRYAPPPSPSWVFPYLFPARGRKRYKTSAFPSRRWCLSLSFPRKGTETRAREDGMGSSISTCLSLSFPRKGTETEVSRDTPRCLFIVKSLSLSFPRKGTETS